MKILLLTPECPLPTLNGIRLRAFHLFSRLAQQHEISLVSFASEEETLLLPALREVFSEVVLVRSVYRRSIGDYALGVISRVPFFVKRMHSEEMAAKVRQLVARGGYDLLCASDLRMAHYLIPYSDHAKIVDACDCLSLLFRRSFLNATQSLSRRLNYLQLWMKVRAYETEVYASFDCCLVVSEVDRKALQSNGIRTPIKVVPNGVDSDFFHPSPAEPVLDNSFTFVGTMSYAPNVDATKFFVHLVLPQITSQVPSASFHIVGRTPSPEVLQLQSKGNVRVIANVDDIRPCVWRSAVFVCPLRIGSGVKNKLLEAMAMGKAVVATTLACEGLHLVTGRELLIADDPDEFARQCILLLRDERLRKELASNARSAARERYSWQRSVEMLQEIVEEVVVARQVGMIAS